MFIDNTPPTITVSPTSATVCKTKSVKITVADTGSGLSSSNSYQYYLSTSSTGFAGGSWTNYTSGTSFTIGSGKTGTYYLWVKQIKDNAGNVSEGYKQTVSNITYHRYGTYVFDNTAPTVSIGTNGGTYVIASGATTCNISTKLLAVDNTNGSGLNLLQYAWSTSNTSEPSSWTNFTNGGIVSTSKGNGIYYLWTKVTDKLGNRATSIKVSSAYLVFSNITITPSTNSITAENITATISYGNTLLSKYVKQYSYNNSTWSTYSNKLTITDSCTLYARIYDTTSNKVIVSKHLDITNIKNLTLTVRSYMSKDGWLPSTFESATKQVGNPQMSYAPWGTSASEFIYKIEAQNYLVGNSLPTDSIQINAHVSNIGWQGYKNANGSNIVGSTDINNGIMNSSGLYYYPYGIEAIQMKVKDSLKTKYDIKYRALNPYTKAWSSWVSNGGTAGTVGASQPICALEIQITRK